MSNISENLGQIDRRLLKVSKLEKNNALDMLDRWSMFLAVTQSIFWVFVTLCLSTLDVSVVPASVCLLGVCLSLSACSMCLLVYVSISLTLLSLFYWICRVLLFFLSRISGSGSGSQSVSGSEPFHTTVSTVYTFWKIANTICSKQLILRKHVLKNYTKIKSYEEGSEFKKMVNFPPSA